MFEKFTDRARKVMALANQEAMRLNHEYIGTEHILLGLVKEGTGVGATVLRQEGIDIRTLREEVEKLVKSGPEMLTWGKLPQTPRAKRVVEYAIEEARALNHNYIGTEHLLLGLLRENEGIAAQILTNLGLTIEGARRTVADLLGSGAARESLPAGGRRPVEPQHDVDYRNLAAWKLADDLAHAVYDVTTGFPKEEFYGVASHLRRTALLIPPNVAEAYGRRSRAEAKWFVNIALGLLQELQYGLDFSVRLECLKNEEQWELGNLASEIGKKLQDLHATLI